MIKNPTTGVMVKVAGKVEPDPSTGQIATTFDDLPQLPFSEFDFRFREGPRAPLITPPRCGSYATQAKFYPWARPEEAVPASSSFQIASGPNGGPCPQGNVPPFHPGFSAGSLNNNAGSYSPFLMRLTRQDGEQDMTKFSSVLPPGALAKIAGVAKCPESGIQLAKEKTGLEERESPSCPARSQIGTIEAGAGVGSTLVYVPGKAYLAGPYNGAPLSVAVITPAVAGPFDVGTVITREALTLNPITGQAQVDGAKSDPIPHILKGIPLSVRDIRVHIDRPDFTIVPTSCDPSEVKGTLFGSFLNLLDPADDVPVALSDRYQAANCLNLGFKPKLQIKLKGSTKRGGHPALKATVKTRPGDANFAGAVVTLPPTAFLDQAHLNNICTRVQFAEAGGNGAGCPPNTIYGHARAKTPLLDETLEGPVYLRSNPEHELPDLVVTLHGLVDIELASRIDSHKGGIRSSFEAIPDAPVTEFTLEMQGGKKGLIENSPPGLSKSLCESRNVATARLLGQNGRRVVLHPALEATSCKKGRKGKGGVRHERNKKHRAKQRSGRS